VRDAEAPRHAVDHIAQADATEPPPAGRADGSL